MAGFNLRTYADHFLQEAFNWQVQDSWPPHMPQGLFLHLINEALRRCQDRLKVDRTRSAANLTAQTMAYTLPTGMLGRDFKIEIVPDSGTGQNFIAPLGYDAFVSIYDIDDATAGTGVPRNYTISKSNDRQILLGPSPSYSATNGIVYTAVVNSTFLGRMYQGDHPPTGSDITVTTLNNGAATCTLSGGTPIDVEIQQYDEFAVRPGFQSDSAAPTTETGRKWYQISSTTVGSNLFTLAENYGERSVSSGTNFLTAEVSELERLSPGKLGFAPVYLALSLYYRTKDPSISQLYKSDYEEAIRSADSSFPRKSQVFIRPTKASASAFLETYYS